MESILAMAHDLVKAQITQKNIDTDSLAHWLTRTHGTLLALLVTEQLPRVELPTGNPAHWRHSITEKSITCLECGGSYKQLTTLHLRKDGITASEYRRKYRMPLNQSLAAKAVSRRRRQVVLDLKPWRKASAARWPKREMER